jgi:hypothetical protein
MEPSEATPTTPMAHGVRRGSTTTPTRAMSWSTVTSLPEKRALKVACRSDASDLATTKAPAVAMSREMKTKYSSVVRRPSSSRVQTATKTKMRSAKGSMSAPMRLNECCRRASQPSRKSVRPAAARMRRRASCCTTTGKSAARKRRDREMAFGIVASVSRSM